MPLSTSLVGDWLCSTPTTITNSVDSHAETAFGSPVMQHPIVLGGSFGTKNGVQTDNTAMGFTGEATDSFYVVGTSGSTPSYSGFAAVYCEQTTPASAGPLFSTRDSAPTAGVWALYLNTNRTVLLLWFDGNNNTRVNLTSATAVAVNALTTIGFTFNSVTGEAHIFINGVDDANATTAQFNTTSNPGVNLLLLGESSRSFPGTTFRLSLWNGRILTGSEFTSLHADPFQSYAPPVTPSSRIILTTVSGGVS